MLYDASILILTAICALFTIIGASPVIKSWLAPDQKFGSLEASASSSTRVPGKLRWLALLGVALIALILSLVGLHRIYSIEIVPTPEKWTEYMGHLQRVRFQAFYPNQEVEIDGKDIEDSSFEDSILVYRGTRPYVLAHNSFRGKSMTFRVSGGPAGSGAELINSSIAAYCKDREMICPIDGHFNLQIVDKAQ
jgi:hypothetical protein